MAHKMYAVSKGGLCPGCGYNRDDAQHFRIHVPRSKWPAAMEHKRKDRVVVSMIDNPCECGYEAKNAQAMTMHRRKAKQHQEAV